LLSARGVVASLGGGVGGLLAGLGFVLRSGFGFAAIGGFLPLGATFFWPAPWRMMIHHSGDGKARQKMPHVSMSLGGVWRFGQAPMNDHRRLTAPARLSFQ
jgi:hypothetical protein